MIKLSFYILIAIIIIDISIGKAFKSPVNNAEPSKLSQYFDYGRSIESKIARIVGTDDSNAAPLARAGWLQSKKIRTVDAVNAGANRQVFVYGMSFSNHVGKILGDLDKDLKVQMFAGPGAPLNHSYSYYNYHRPHDAGDIIILGILASSLPRINTLTHMTANFESPAGHFYPRYRLDQQDQLIQNEVSIDSLAKLRQSIRDKSEWKYIKESLAEHDSYYDPIVFSHNISDYSVYARMLKRAWGQRNSLKTLRRYHDHKGFKNTDRMIEIARALVVDFAQKARADRAIPYVILFNDRGYSDHLFQIMQPIFIAEKIPYYSTHLQFPATQLSNFIPDGHFTPAIEQLIGERVLDDINTLRRD